MKKLITDYLDEAASVCPQKVAFVEKDNKVTYEELRSQSQSVAKAIEEEGLLRKPVAVYIGKSIACIEAFLGTAYSGNFYCLVDTEMPDARSRKILDVLEPELMLTDRRNAERAVGLAAGIKVLVIEDLLQQYCGQEINCELRKTLLSSDILYVLFTSGSTGVPKGVITSHRALLSYVKTVAEAYRIDEDTVIGNQVPFYYVMSIFDIYETIAMHAQMHIIPRKYFAFPATLIRYLHDNNINTIDWVPSALALVANVNGFQAADISGIRTVIFGGEVMPIKHLKAWQRALPNAAFFNGYGSTEGTEASVFYEVNREFNDGDTLPIGRPYSNTEALVINENNQLVTDEIGELYIRCDALSYGYYGDLERTAEVFIQNPLHNKYRDIVYKTGDLVRYNRHGEIEYVGRKDAQIKHMGRRIELGEIEANASSISGVREGCCIYDREKQQIVLFYTGDIKDADVANALKELVPDYMLPSKRVRLDNMPHNHNGKIDRTALADRL